MDCLSCQINFLPPIAGWLEKMNLINGSSKLSCFTTRAGKQRLMSVYLPASFLPEFIRQSFLRQRRFVSMLIQTCSNRKRVLVERGCLSRQIAHIQPAKCAATSTNDAAATIDYQSWTNCRTGRIVVHCVSLTSPYLEFSYPSSIHELNRAP